MIQIAFAFDAKDRRKTPFTKERRNLTEACFSENVQREYAWSYQDMSF
jgi:hypothetical protein